MVVVCLSAEKRCVCLILSCVLSQVDAETFVNRASSLMEDVKDVVLQLRYRTTYARVLDANRKFLEAALRYYDLSQTQKKEISQVSRDAVVLGDDDHLAAGDNAGI